MNRRTSAWIGRALLGLLLPISLAGQALGVSPQKPDVAMLAMAPADKIAVIHWFGLSAPDAQSTNKTEQLFAEEEIQAFLKAIDKLIQNTIATAATSPGGPPQEIVEKVYTWSKEIAGQPGLAYLSRLELSPEASRLKDIDAGVALRLGERASVLRADIEQLFQQAQNAQVKQVTIDGQSCSQITSPRGDLTLTWTTQGDYFLLTAGDSAMKQLLARQKAQTPPAWLVQSAKQVRVERRWMIAHVDFEAIRQLSLPALPPEAHTALTELGLLAIDQVDFSSGLDGTGCKSHTSFQLKAFQGLLALAEAQPLSASDLASIPAGSQTAVAFRLSPADLHAKIEALATSMGPKSQRDWARIHDEIREKLGIDLKTDLIAPLGDTWYLYQSGTAFGVLPTMVAGVSVRDSARLTATHDKLLAYTKQILAAASRNNGSTPSIATTEIQGKPAYYLQGVPLAIAWQITDKQLVVATSVQTLKAHQNRKPDADSLAKHAAVAATLQDSPPLLIGYNDSQRTMESLFQSLPMFAAMMAGELSKKGIDFDTSVLPAWETVQPHLEPSTFAIARNEKRLNVVTRESLPVISAGGLTLPVGVALLLPAVQAARHSATRAQSMNNAKQLSLAILNFESAFGGFPAAAIRTKDGAPGLSWRVAILPFIEEQTLYNEFHLDEPWDSEHNKKLIERMPAVFRSPLGNAVPGKTNYLAVRSKQSVIRESDTKLSTRMRDITDGTSMTIWLVEANNDQAVEWTKPDDYVVDEQNLGSGLGGLMPGEVFLAAFCDGHIQVLQKSIAAETLKALFTRDGGEVVNLP